MPADSSACFLIDLVRNAGGLERLHDLGGIFRSEIAVQQGIRRALRPQRHDHAGCNGERDADEQEQRFPARRNQRAGSGVGQGLGVSGGHVSVCRSVGLLVG